MVRRDDVWGVYTVHCTHTVHPPPINKPAYAQKRRSSQPCHPLMCVYPHNASLYGRQKAEWELTPLSLSALPNLVTVDLWLPSKGGGGWSLSLITPTHPPHTQAGSQDTQAGSQNPQDRSQDPRGTGQGFQAVVVDSQAMVN